MSALKVYNQQDILSFVKSRKGETKFGEKVKFIKDPALYKDEMISSKAKYVLFGIQESIGIKANGGVQGAETTFQNTLKSFLNTQNNTYNKGKKVLVLGHLEFPKLMKASEDLNPANTEDLKQLYHFVNEIDQEVANLVFSIVNAGKIPIIIGGGHNNAYGNIKGTSLALNEPINVVNLDAHSDFRSLEGRHSGNGFSYALTEGFLNNYYIFGLHENYTSKVVFDLMTQYKNQVQYTTFEDLKVRNVVTFENEIKQVKNFLKGKRVGLEIDLDAVQNIASSAITPSGFSVNETRQFIYNLRKQQVSYLHICEGASKLEVQDTNQTGKLISYLISDFIRKK